MRDFSPMSFFKKGKSIKLAESIFVMERLCPVPAPVQQLFLAFKLPL